MNKQSLVERIRLFLKEKGTWIHGEEITKYGQSLGYEGETARRRLRDLLEEGVVETKAERGLRAKSNWYRYVPKETVRTKIEVIEGIAYQRQEKLFV